MTSSANNATIVGNLTRDPELRFSVNGRPTVDLAVAVNRRWENLETHKWEEATSFFDVVCWGELAKNVAESASSGTRVVVTGRLEQRSWQSKGRRRSKLEFVVDEVALSVRFGTGSVTRSIRPPDADAGGGRPTPP